MFVECSGGMLNAYGTHTAGAHAARTQRHTRHTHAAHTHTHDTRTSTQKPRRAYAAELKQFHTSDYVEFLARVAPGSARDVKEQLQRFNMGEDCPVFDGLYDYCRLSAGASIAGAQRCVRARRVCAVCVCRVCAVCVPCVCVCVCNVCA